MIYITGEKGFIASNLSNVLKQDNFDIANLDNDTIDFSCLHHRIETGEPCIYRNDMNAWKNFFKHNNISYVIHNAAVVGTDVVALNMQEATLTNVLGTETILRAANSLDIPVTYLGTTVVYKTQPRGVVIDENTKVAPQTYYGVTKAAADLLAKKFGANIARPLFAYGGVGDMNSLIVKYVYAAVSKRAAPLDIFLDPVNVKDYMHVLDFCRAISCIVKSGRTGDDYIISAETGQPISQILTLIKEVCNTRNLNDILIKCHPETDYLGDHILSSHKFRMHFPDWKCIVELQNGIESVVDDVLAHQHKWNPMRHLDSASVNDIKQNFK